MAVTELTGQSFEAAVTNHDFIIVDFWSPSCGPCRVFAPLFETIAKEYPDILFAKVNIQDEPEIAAHFQIRAVPTLMVIRQQIIVFNRAGAPSELGLRDLIAKAATLDMLQMHTQVSKKEGDA